MRVCLCVCWGARGGVGAQNRGKLLFMLSREFIGLRGVLFSDSFKRLAAAPPTHRRHKYGIHICSSNKVGSSVWFTAKNAPGGVKVGDTDVFFWSAGQRKVCPLTQIQYVRRFYGCVWSGKVAAVILERAVCETTKFNLVIYEKSVASSRPYPVLRWTATG